MKSTKAEALSLFAKWKEETTSLFCFVNLPPLKVGLERVTVESFGPQGITVRSEDGSKLSFRFPTSVVFDFGDLRSGPVEAAAFESGLSICLDEPSIARREGLTLLERRTS